MANDKKKKVKHLMVSLSGQLSYPETEPLHPMSRALLAILRPRVMVEVYNAAESLA
jgi:hypothetical protein